MTRLLQSLENLKIKENDVEYLKLKEVASQLRAEGYNVIESPTGTDKGFDLVATKDGKKLAIEVKVSSQLQESAESIKALRKRALEQRYDEFRLILVSPPHEIPVKIDSLDKELSNQMKEESYKNYLKHPGDSYFDNYELEKVSDIEIDSVSIAVEGIRIQGNGVVSVIEKLPEGSLSQISGAVNISRWANDLPFQFDVTLDRELKISSVNGIEIDNSSFDE